MVAPSARREIPLEAIREAAGTVYDLAVRTPLIPLDPPGGATQAGQPRVYVKLETLQPIGAFKIRGAYNAVRRLSSQARARGVWTVSAGNAAQGVALAARRVGAACAVMMIETAPETKRRAIELLGGTIVAVPYDEAWRTVEQHASARMRGAMVHPFDDDHVIAGNGTIALEILEDLPDVTSVIAAVGGGGLVAGIAAVLRALRPDVKIFGAEPETAAPLAVSIASGQPSVFPHWQASFVDGAGGKSVLPSMWPLISPPRIDGSIVVTLEQVRAAMRVVAERTHVIVEGAAACAVAAALTGRAGPGPVVAVLSGGNIDLALFAALVSSPVRSAI
ncbi:MAG: pyridoxal-phosphate dependent enzyme [Luteitalea sp.]|nr:pyridoxal-phosphate dependent enzyme [Luteitalea sp.]